MINHQFNVLLADDDANDRELLRLAAVKEGLPVRLHEVEDGQEVIDYLEGRGRFAERNRFPVPDLLVVDLKMPRVNGLEVIDWLRKHPYCASLPAVMLSGSGLSQDVEEAYRRGVNTYFAKSGDIAEFRRLILVMFDYWLKSQRPVTKDCGQH